MRTALEWVLETTSARLLLASDEGTILRANGQIERAFGYPRSGLIGLRFDALVSASCRDVLDARLHELIAEPESSRRASLDALVALRNDGSEFEAALNLDVVQHEGQCLVAGEFIETAATPSLEKFAMALDDAPTGMLLVDDRGLILYVNRQTERMFGYERGALVGEAIERLVPLRSRAQHVGLRNEFSKNAQTRAMGAGQDLYGVRRDGSEVPVEIGLSAVTLDGRRCVLSSIVDITERKRALDHFRLALEAAPTGMMVVDDAGKISLVNAQIERIFGHDRRSLMGRSLEDLVPPSARADHPSFRQAFCQNPTARPMGAGRELHGLHRDGRHVPVEIGLTPIDSPGSKMVLTSVIDITERQLAERALRHSEARHRELFSNSPIALLEQDFSQARAYLDSLQVMSRGTLSSLIRDQPEVVLTAVDKVTTLMANEQALTLFEVAGASELNPLSALLTTDTFEWFRKGLCDLHEGKRHFGEETRMQTRRGNIKVVYKRMHLLSGHQGTWSSVVVSLFDVTAHKHAEDRLRASLREKEVLLREVHHRVKNNLQIVSSLLNLKADAFDDPAMQQVFADCQARVRSLAILHEHLYTSRDLSNVSISSYIRTLLEHLRQSIRSPGRAISLGVEVDEIGLALDDAIPCGLIVNELVTNALKHAFPGRRNGCISVRLRTLDSGELELMVSDDGVGLPHGAEPGPASLGSSGLDLVFTFAEQLRARVEIHRGGGTRFSVRFTPTPWANRQSG